jgi:PTS system nitrogen regulatory IIA component
VRLADILTSERITTSLSATDKPTVLRELSKLLAQGSGGLEAEAIELVLAEREALASTGVGSGVAIPHGRAEGIDAVRAALAVQREGVAFDAIDGQPVHIFVAVLAPAEQPSEHLRTLAGVSRLLRELSVRDALREADGAEQVLAIVRDQDEG